MLYVCHEATGYPMVPMPAIKCPIMNVVKKVRIDFEAINVALPDLDWQKVREWIGKVAAMHGCMVRRLLYVFMDDAGILKANIEALGHDYYTDIITYDYTRGKELSGEMEISLDTVASNAEMLGQPYERELLRVIIHGVLHLTGINDKGPGERAVMEAAENQALSLYYIVPSTSPSECECVGESGYDSGLER